VYEGINKHLEEAERYSNGDVAGVLRDIKSAVEGKK